MIKVTIKEFSAQTGFALARVKSAIYRTGVSAVGSKGQEFLYYLNELELATQPRVKLDRYVKKIPPADSRPEGSVTLNEFLADKHLKYHTLDSRIRSKKVSSDGFVYKGQYKCKTYPVDVLNKLSN
jgi:hypothetical protein